MPIQKNEKQEKAKLPRQGGPVPEGDSEKQNTAKLPRQGGEVGDVEVHGLKQAKVGVGLDRHDARVALHVDAEHGVGLGRQAERVALQVQCQRHGEVGHDLQAERVALPGGAAHGVGLDLHAERAPEGDSEKQDTAKLPRQGGKEGELEAHGHEQGKVGVGLELLAERVALLGVDVHGVGRDLHAECAALQVRNLVTSQQAKQEFFIGDLPNTLTRDVVEGIFSKFGIVLTCELLHNNDGLLMAKLRMCSRECAQVLAQHVDGHMDVGLESPVFVGFFKDYDGWWVP
jgi:hypothetical protein